MQQATDCGVDFVTPTLARALHGTNLADHAVRRLALHWLDVVRWNTRVNLTAIVDTEEAALLHYRDSLAGMPFLGEGPVVDLGSGAGFPGIVLAVARPDLAFTLVEPRRKRASFLRAAVARMRLQNVSVRECRMQDRPGTAYGTVVTRATFSRAEDLAVARRWVAAGGRMIAYRGAAAQMATHDCALHCYRVGRAEHRLDIWPAVT